MCMHVTTTIREEEAINLRMCKDIERFGGKEHERGLKEETWEELEREY